MKSEKIASLIRACKENSDINSIFGDRIAYSSFFEDLDDYGLVFEPIFTKNMNCLSNSLISVKIFDKKDGSSRMELKKIMEIVEDFLVSKLKNFSGFETLAVVEKSEEVILKNNKDRLVFIKRFEFYF